MIVWPWWSFARSVLAAGNSHACSWQFEMTCTVTQQVDGPTQKWKDTKRWWHSPEGPSIVPRMWPPVLWPEADCHLEHLSIHHVCHHPQETWEAESRTAEFFFTVLETAAAGSALKAPLQALLYFHVSCSPAEVRAEERCDWELAILHRTETSIKRKVKENHWRKYGTVSITTNLAAAKQGIATQMASHSLTQTGLRWEKEKRRFCRQC